MSSQVLPKPPRPPLLAMHNLSGSCDERFAKVEKVFKKNFLDGWEREGAAFAVFHRGRLVVDLQGGFQDASALARWTDSTRTVVFSVSKAVAALCVAMLVERGRVRYEQRLAEFWPEFAQHGKQDITLDWVMTHRAGLVLFEHPVSLEMAACPERMARALEAMRPAWPPGSRSGYHALTFGWLVDQVVRRVDLHGRGVAQFFRQEIGEPHGVDFFFGLPASEQHTVARLSLPSTSFVLKEVLRDPRVLLAYLVVRLNGPVSVRKQVENIGFIKTEGNLNTFNSPHLHRLEQPAALGITRARDLAKTFALMLDGTLLSKEFTTRFRRPQLQETDCCIKVPSMKGHGFMYEKHPFKPDQFLYGHPGFGGSVLTVEPEEELVMVYLCNGLKVGNGEVCYTYRALRNAVLESVQQGK